MSSAVLERPSIDYWEPVDNADADPWVDTGDEAYKPTAHGRTSAEGGSASNALTRSLISAARFNRLADELAADAAGVSSTRRLVAHPAYGGILLMGREAIPFLIERVQSGEHRPTWLKLLGSLTSLPPSAGQETIDGSANAWIRWAMTEAPRV